MKVNAAIMLFYPPNGTRKSTRKEWIFFDMMVLAD